VSGYEVESPSDDVLLELGRLVWAAINLEDAVYAVCRSVKPRTGPFDYAPIGSRIKDALGDLDLRDDVEVCSRVSAWLQEANGALVERNQVLHSVPASFEPLPGSAPVPEDAKGTWLVHFGRARGGSRPPPVHTPMRVATLRKTRRRLVSARDGWADVASALYTTQGTIY
jgi:hypothetical protein